MRDPRLLAEPPVTRLGCLVLVRNRRGHVLLVDPDYMDGLILPGGAARPNEPPHRAAARHLHAETGLHLRLTDCVAVDFTPAGRYLKRLTFVFDGGTVRDTPSSWSTPRTGTSGGTGRGAAQYSALGAAVVGPRSGWSRNSTASPWSSSSSTTTSLSPACHSGAGA